MSAAAATAMAAPPAPTAFLPIASALDGDSAAIIAVVLRYLPLAQQLHDNDRANYYLRRLLSILDQRFDLSDTTRTQLVQCVMSILVEAQELHLQIRCMQVLNQLFKCKQMLPDLSIAWRPLLSLLSSLHFPSARTFTYPQSLLQQHSAQLVKLVRGARRYFPAGAGEDVWSAFSPFLSPFDNASTRSFSLISLFTPTHQPQHESALLIILPSLLQYGTWYDHSPTALVPFFSLYARIAKHQLSISLLPQLPHLYSTYLQLLELDVGNQQSSNNVRTVQAYAWLNDGSGGNALETISKCLAKVTVFLLHHSASSASPATQSGQRSALSVLAQFLHTVNTYFHPSNQGKWSNPLAALLSELGTQYAKRRGKEAHGAASYDRQHFLSQDDNSFVSVMLPTALQALFSKSHSMVSAAETWLKHVAFFHPSLVLPALLSHVYPALDDLSSPHRMLSIMQALSQLAPILFHRQYYPQGAQHLDALLWAALPGVDAIDAMKTSLTLTFYTIVFYHIAMIDARKSDSLTKTRADRHDDAKPRTIERITSHFKQLSESGGVEKEEEEVRPIDDEEEEDLSEDDARAATFRFEDWSLAFLDSIFTLLSSADKYAKADFLDVHSARLLGKVLRAFFACQSEDIFLSCAAKIVRAVLGKQEMNATKQWGIIIATASLRGPQVMLSRLFDPLYQRIVSSGQGGGGRKVLSGIAKSELEWALYLMSQVVKQAGGGDEKHTLLAYKEKVVTAYRLTCQHEERTVRKVSGKLIRNFIAALCSVYPSEWRPFDNRQWSDTERWRHWNVWCSFTPEEERDDAVIDPRIVWHVPSEEEMQVVDELVNGEMEEPLAVLSRFVEGKDEERRQSGDEKEEKGGKGDGAVERALLCVANIIRGAQTVLGDIEGSRSKQGEEEGQEEREEADSTAADAAFTGARCPLVNVKRSRPLRTVKNRLSVLSSSSSVRFALLPYLHRLSERLLSSLSGPASSSSLKSLTLYIKLLSFTLLSYGVNETKVNADQYIAGFTRQWMREWRSGFRISCRPLLVQRAYHYYLMRTADASKGQRYSDEVRLLLSDLHRLSTNDFAKVRQKAHKALVAAIFHFPQSIDFTLTAITTTLSSQASNAEQISGCLSVLADPTVIALSARRWSRLVQVVDALSRGVSANDQRDDKVEVLLQTYFSALFPSLYPLPVYIAEMQSGQHGDIGEDKVRRRNDAIARYNIANESRYRGMMASLLQHAQNPSLHWRYQLMSTAFLFILLKPSALVPSSSSSISSPSSPSSPSTLYDDVVLFFLNTLRSELSPMRHIANEALANILGMHYIALQQQRRQQAGHTPPPPDTNAAFSAASPGASVTKDGTSLPITLIENEEQLLSTVYYDWLYSGWQDEAGAVSSYYARAGDSDEYALYRTASPYFTGIPTSLHPTATGLSSSVLSAISSSLSSHLPAIITFLVQHHPTLDAKVEGASSSSSGQTGAGDQISALACSHFAPVLWPFTRIQAQSKAFDFTHVALVRGLVEAVGAIVESGGVWEREVKRLLDKPEQDNQCTAAEIIAGIVKGSKHMTMKRQQSIQAWLLPALLSALSSSQPDAVSHWTAALRFIYSNMDPRRLAWLTRPLLLSALNALPPSSPASAVDVTSPLLQYKRFHFLIPVLVEQGYRASHLSQWLLQRVTRDGWLASEYKQVRSEVAWIVFLSLENQFRVNTPQRGVMELVVSEGMRDYISCVVKRLLAVEGVLYRSKGGEEKKDDEDSTMDEQEEAEGLGSSDAAKKNDAAAGEKKDDTTPHEAKLLLETLLSSLLLSLLAGSAIALSPQYQALLPYAIQSQHVTDIECAALGKQVAKVAAWAALKGVVTEVQSDGEVRIERRFDAAAVIANVLSEVNDLLLSTAPSSSWHVKVSALRYLQVVIPRHSLLMTAQHVTDVETTILQMLVHGQVEVREQAAATLSSLLSSCLSHPSTSVIGFSSSRHASAHVLRLLKHCTYLSRTAYRDKSNSKRVDLTLLARRHGGVLGLLSLIACHPYDLPRHLPPLLEQLAGHVNDPQPISGAVRKGFAEFLRTHKEEWDASFKERFTEEQLEAVNSVQSAPTYFA